MPLNGKCLPGSVYPSPSAAPAPASHPTRTPASASPTPPHPPHPPLSPLSLPSFPTPSPLFPTSHIPSPTLRVAASPVAASRSSSIARQDALKWHHGAQISDALHEEGGQRRQGGYSGRDTGEVRREAGRCRDHSAGLSGRITVELRLAVLKEAQDYFRGLTPESELWSEELIAERRREARREAE